MLQDAIVARCDSSLNEVDPLGNLNDFKRKLVEAVGIEPSSEQPASNDSVAITRARLDRETGLNPSESELTDQLGTRVPNFDSIDDLPERVRWVWGALRVA